MMGSTLVGPATMREFNWLLAIVLVAIATLVGAALYFLPNAGELSDHLIILIGIGSMLLIGGLQDLFGK